MRARTRTGLAALSIFALAFATGLGSVGGGFLSGDDYHLVRNHVLVNHPSLGHALELFTIVHRDLYQPIPLVSFSIDFAIIHALGLDPVATGPNAGAWVFHLTNIFIHALNAMLVFFLIRRWTNVSRSDPNRPRQEAVLSVMQDRSLTVAARIGLRAQLALGSYAVPIVAAAIFAIHPLAAEPIAWLNGRMMMLSTFFTLATLITLDRWDARPTAPRAVFTVLLSMAAHMSKVSPALPIFALIAPLAQRRRPRRRWWIMWAVLASITTAFTLFAVYSSGEMFKRAQDEMSGSPFCYVMLALGQYFRQFLVPVGLSAWYPPPDNISWTKSLVITSAVTVLLVLFVTLLSLRRTRVGALGLIWFLAGVAPTLPIVPARRAIAADRYVYLPNIGLQWIAATLLVALFIHLRRYGRGTNESQPPENRWSPATVLSGVVCGVTAILLMAASWHTQSYYHDNITLAQRIMLCDPDYPSVYESAAWAYYREGQFENAIGIALEDLRRHPKKMACEVYQVVGMSQYRLHRYHQALDSLHKAVQANPDYGKAYSRLAKVQTHLHQYQAAIKNYERAVQIMPYYNPGLLNLASLYRKVGRIDDAVDTYNKVLTANPYDVTAQLALAEIDILRERFEPAVQRLQKLLQWMPENNIARTNLGLACESLNRTQDAIDAYTTVIDRDPQSRAALVNLADLYLRHDRLHDARHLFDTHMPILGDDLAFLIAYHDYALHINRPDLAADAFLRAHRHRTKDVMLRQWAAYTLAQTNTADPRPERSAEVSRLLSSAAGTGHSDTTALRCLTKALTALQSDEPETAIENVKVLVALKNPHPPGSKARLIRDLERFADAHPQNPWPYYLSAVILTADNQRHSARLARDEFIRLCPNQECQARAKDLLVSSPPSQP